MIRQCACIALDGDKPRIGNNPRSDAGNTLTPAIGDTYAGLGLGLRVGGVGVVVR